MMNQAKPWYDQIQDIAYKPVCLIITESILMEKMYVHYGGQTYCFELSVLLCNLKDNNLLALITANERSRHSNNANESITQFILHTKENSFWRTETFLGNLT